LPNGNYVFANHLGTVKSFYKFHFNWCHYKKSAL
jgi:hypothetical protein